MVKAEHNVEAFPGVEKAMKKHKANPTLENHVEVLHETVKGALAAIYDLAEAIDQIETHLGFQDPEQTN